MFIGGGFFFIKRGRKSRDTGPLSEQCHWGIRYQQLIKKTTLQSTASHALLSTIYLPIIRQINRKHLYSIAHF